MIQGFTNLITEHSIIDPTYNDVPLEIEIQNLTVEVMELTDKIISIERLLINIHDTMVKHLPSTEPE